MKNSDILDDIALYDVMFEQGTRLGSMYVAYQRRARKEGDKATARRWLQKSIDLQRERYKIDPNNRTAMINAYDRWSREENRLYAAYTREHTVKSTRHSLRKSPN